MPNFLFETTRKSGNRCQNREIGAKAALFLECWKLPKECGFGTDLCCYCERSDSIDSGALC